MASQEPVVEINCFAVDFVIVRAPRIYAGHLEREVGGFFMPVMPELPWIPWFPQLWLSESGLSLCSAATRGIWADALNHMLVSSSDTIIGEKQQLAVLCRCRPQEIEVAAIELDKFKVAIVKWQNDSITITCRRIQRDLKVRELKRKAGEKGAAKRWQTDSRGGMARSPSPSISPSEEGGMQGGKQCVQPTWNEWWGVCQMVGLPEWKAKDEYQKQETKDDPWKGARGNLQHHAARVRTWWQADGSPMEPPSRGNGSGGVKRWEIQKQFDLVQKEIKEIEDRASMTATDRIIEPRDLNRYSRLKAQRKDLRTQLGL